MDASGSMFLTRFVKIGKLEVVEEFIRHCTIISKRRVEADRIRIVIESVFMW